MSQIDRPKLKVSQGGLELIKSFEGFRPRAERLADGRWVIGHGHTLSAREGATVDAAEAELLLLYDLLPILNAIAERVHLPLNPHQVDALASFGLNLGLERFLASDVLVWVNAGEPEDAARALIACDAQPLTPAADPVARRRAAESALFRHDPTQEVDLAALLNAPVPAPVIEPAAPGPDPVSPPAGPPASDDGARARAVAVLLGEAGPRQEEAGPGPSEAVEAAVITPFFGAAPAPTPANENSHEPPEAPADAAPEMGTDAAPGPQADLAAALAMQRYSPYVASPAWTAAGAIDPAVDPFGAPQAELEVVAAEPEPETAVEPVQLESAGFAHEAAETERLVLTSPPEAAPEPPTREVWPDSARPGPAVQEEPLFIEDPALRAGAQPVFMPESFESERGGRLDWSETGAFLGMGAVGLTAFGAAVFGFRMAADRPVSAGLDQTTIASWVLALIGALCVGISAYNLYLRWARRGEG